MLLTCPACSARYEVPATVLPVAGRVVRCSACHAEWLARPETPAPRPVPPVPEVPLVTAPVVAAPARAMPVEATARALSRTLEDGPEPYSGGGFVAGFATVTVAVVLALTVYIKHGALAEAWPVLSAPLAQYVAVVDAGRAELERLMAQLRPAP